MISVQMEKLDEWCDKLQLYFQSNPKAGLLFVVGLEVLLLVGIIRGWKWAAEPSGYFQTYFYNLMGSTTFRFWIGVLTCLAILCTVMLYFIL